MQDIWNAIKEAFSKASEEDSEAFLWNATCYPFGDKEQILNNIKEMKEKSNGDID